MKPNHFNIDAPDFHLEATLESGQVFGFEKAPDGAYEGSVRGIPVRLRQNGALHVESPRAFPAETVADYFDLTRDLSGIYALIGAEPALRPALEKYRGLRLIRQDSWEALACFIISSNNNVKRIQGIWKNLAARFGGFPRPEQIARSHERILRELGLGYRAPFLLSTACFVAANPVCLETIREAPYAEAVRRVIAFPGIGPKVADCALLYGFHKLEAFPVDVWILRAVRKLYFRNRSVSEKRVQAFGQKKWGANAGYVQQYLFHAARMDAL